MPATKRKPPVDDIDAILDRRPGTIHAALVAVQAELRTIKRDASNPHFRSSYASLDAILAVILPLITAQGCYHTCELQYTADGAGWLEARIVHGASETSLESRWRMESLGGSSQQIGSELTYARRYLLSAMLSLSTGGDDDAEAAKERKPNSVREKVPGAGARSRDEVATSAQVKRTCALFREAGYDDERRREAIRATTRGRTTAATGLSSEEATRVINRLEQLASTGDLPNPNQEASS